MIGQAIMELTVVNGSDTRRISHALKVLGFARAIAEAEGLTGEALDIVELSATLHDIAIRFLRRKIRFMRRQAAGKGRPGYRPAHTRTLRRQPRRCRARGLYHRSPPHVRGHRRAGLPNHRRGGFPGQPRRGRVRAGSLSGLFPPVLRHRSRPGSGAPHVRRRIIRGYARRPASLAAFAHLYAGRGPRAPKGVFRMRRLSALQSVLLPLHVLHDDIIDIP